MTADVLEPPLILRLLGAFEVSDHTGAAVDMPPSKKTRALMAFLALNPRPQRRERLCEIFWELPDDPMGALRWSLSKIRKIVNADGRERLVANRETVAFDHKGIQIDWCDLREASEKGFSSLPILELERLAEQIRGRLLEDLSLSRCPDFEAWRTAEAAASDAVTVELLQTLIGRLGDDPVRALHYASKLRGIAFEKADVDGEIERLKRSAASLGNIDTTQSQDNKNSRPGVGNVVGTVLFSTAMKPSIVILPFDNMSEPGQDYISDGITEDIITELSRFRSLRVISRNSSFIFKDRAVSVKEVGAELGVSYLVEGSVRKAGSRLRINAQLVDAESGEQIWAERYQRDVGDIFELQEEIARTVAAAIEPETGKIERQRSLRKPLEDLSSWDWYQQGLSYLYQDTKDGNEKALVHLRRSMELAGDFAPSHAAAAHVLFNDLISGHREMAENSINEAFRYAEKAISLDDKDAMAHMVLGRLHLLRRNYEDSIAELDTAIDLNPSYADAHHGLGFTLIYSGTPDFAVPEFDMAIELSPFDPRISSFYEMRAWALLVTKKYDEAAISARTAVRRPNAQHWAFATLCSVLGHQGQIDEAAAALAELQSRKPDFSARFVREYVYYNKKPEHLEHYIEGLIKAGLPE
jgi:TolB-like protein/Flp pilus assembly protein TadD